MHGDSCVVCFDAVPAAAARCSDGEHALCDDCFTAHVEALTDVRLAAGRGRVPCPCNDWHGGSFGTEAIADVYTRKGQPRALERYLERALPKAPVPAQLTGEIEALGARLAELLSIRCPRCDVVVDPTPDGCRAMRCGHCGSYFCWVCFQLEVTNTRLHHHVQLAHGDLYLHQRGVDAAHRLWRRRVVRGFMLDLDEPTRRAVLTITRPSLAAPEVIEKSPPPRACDARPPRQGGLSARRWHRIGPDVADTLTHPFPRRRSSGTGTSSALLPSTPLSRCRRREMPTRATASVAAAGRRGRRMALARC